MVLPNAILSSIPLGYEFFITSSSSSLLWPKAAATIATAPTPNNNFPAGYFLTSVVKGISPRLTYRQKDSYSTVPKNTKGPGFGTQSTAQYIRNKPGRISGTQFGTSRAPLPRHDEYDDNVFSLFDLKDPMERSFLHHQKRVNRIKNCENTCGYHR